MLLILAIGFACTQLHSQSMKKGLTRSEKKFVKNVVKAQREKLIEITKTDDNNILVEFNSTKVMLKPNGYIGEVWIRTENDWLSLGTAEEAY